MLQIGTPGMAPPMVVTTGRARGATLGRRPGSAYSSPAGFLDPAAARRRMRGACGCSVPTAGVRARKCGRLPAGRVHRTLEHPRPGRPRGLPAARPAAGLPDGLPLCARRQAVDRAERTTAPGDRLRHAPPAAAQPTARAEQRSAAARAGHRAPDPARAGQRPGRAALRWRGHAHLGDLRLHRLRGAGASPAASAARAAGAADRARRMAGPVVPAHPAGDRPAAPRLGHGAGPAGGTVVHRGSTQPPGFAARGTGRLAGRSAGSTDRPCPGAVARRPGATLDHRGTGSRGRPIPLGVRRALHPPARPAAHALPVPVATATGRPPPGGASTSPIHRYAEGDLPPDGTSRCDTSCCSACCA